MVLDRSLRAAREHTTEVHMADACALLETQVQERAVLVRSLKESGSDDVAAAVESLLASKRALFAAYEAVLSSLGESAAADEIRAKQSALVPAKERKAMEKEAKRAQKNDPKAHAAAFKAKQQQSAVEPAAPSSGPLLGSACGDNPLAWPETQPLPLLVAEAIDAFLRGKSSATELQGLLSVWDYSASVKLDGTNVGLELLPGPDEAATTASLVGRRFRISPTACEYCHTSLEQVRALDSGRLLAGLRAELPMVGLPGEGSDGEDGLVLHAATLYGELIVSDMLIYDYAEAHGSGRWLGFGLMLDVGSAAAAQSLERALARDGWAACALSGTAGQVRVALSSRLRDVLLRLGVPVAPMQREGAGGLCTLVEAESEWLHEMLGEGLIVTLCPPGRPARLAKWKISAERQAACVAALTALDSKLADSSPADTPEAVEAADGGRDTRSARQRLCEEGGEAFAAQVARLVRSLLEVSTAPLSLHFQRTTMAVLPNKYSHKAMVLAQSAVGDDTPAPGSGGDPEGDEWEAQAKGALDSALTKLDALDAHFSAGEPAARVAAALVAEMRNDISTRGVKEEARLVEYVRAYVESVERAWRAGTRRAGAYERCRSGRGQWGVAAASA